MLLFDKMTFDEKLEYKLAEKEMEQLRAANTDLVERRQSLEAQIGKNDSRMSELMECRVKLAEKYSA